MITIHTEVAEDRAIARPCKAQAGGRDVRASAFVAGMVISVDAICPFVVGVCGARRLDVGTTATGVCNKLFEGVR